MDRDRYRNPAGSIGDDSDHPAAALLATGPARGGAAVGFPYSLAGARCTQAQTGLRECQRWLSPPGAACAPGKAGESCVCGHVTPVSCGPGFCCSLLRSTSPLHLQGRGHMWASGNPMQEGSPSSGDWRGRAGWSLAGTERAGDGSPLPAVPCALPRPVPLAWQTLGMAPHLPLQKNPTKIPITKPVPLQAVTVSLIGACAPPPPWSPATAGHFGVVFNLSFSLC